MKRIVIIVMFIAVTVAMVASDISLKVKWIDCNLKTSDMDYVNLLMLAGVVIIVFFLLRELWTWYWKINMLVANQNITQDLLREILNELKKQTPKDDTKKTID